MDNDNWTPPTDMDALRTEARVLALLTRAIDEAEGLAYTFRIGETGVAVMANVARLSEAFAALHALRRTP